MQPERSALFDNLLPTQRDLCLCQLSPCYSITEENLVPGLLSRNATT